MNLIEIDSQVQKFITMVLFRKAKLIKEPKDYLMYILDFGTYSKETIECLYNKESIGDDDLRFQVVSLGALIDSPKPITKFTDLCIKVGGKKSSNIAYRFVFNYIEDILVEVSNCTKYVVIYVNNNKYKINL